jgi:hypothetical protein
MHNRAPYYESITSSSEINLKSIRDTATATVQACAGGPPRAASRRLLAMPRWTLVLVVAGGGDSEEGGSVAAAADDDTDNDSLALSCICRRPGKWAWSPARLGAARRLPGAAPGRSSWHGANGLSNGVARAIMMMDRIM